MVFGSLKGLFGGGSETPPARTGPFGLGIGRAVAMDTMRLRLEEGRLARGLPPPTLVVSGHGVAELDGTGSLHRYYDDAGAMLQVLCVGGIGDEFMREITLYHPWDEVVPASAAEWATWDGEGGRIGAPVFEADGFRFERAWGDPATPWVAPAEFTETISFDEGETRVLHHKMMPYRREIGTAVEALIIAVERDLASNDRGSVTFMIGYGLGRADVTPV
jgi:hypothetical protein